VDAVEDYARLAKYMIALKTIDAYAKAKEIRSERSLIYPCRVGFSMHASYPLILILQPFPSLDSRNHPFR
jgi:hypothetical protein